VQAPCCCVERVSETPEGTEWEKAIYVGVASRKRDC